MIDGGYVLQPRKFDESEASRMPPITRELFQYIVRKVNHADNKKFKRGQNFFNLGDIQEALCWYVGYRKMVYSKPQLTKSLRRLSESTMIATAKATRGLIVTVCNYDQYQNPKNYEGNNEGTTKATRRQRQGHTKNKNDKNERIEEKKKIQKKIFTPPTLEDVINYFIENNLPATLGNEAFEYYNVAGWEDARGNKVKNWKQKMRGVWFKNKQKNNKHNNFKDTRYEGTKPTDIGWL